MDSFVCPQGNDAAIAAVKKFKATIEDAVNAVNTAKKKIDEIPEAEATVGANYTRTVEFLNDIENVICKQYPLLVEQYEGFIKKMQEVDAELKK